MGHTHTHSVVEAFTAQAESFNTSQAATDEGLLDAIVTMADPRPGERWLEAACGPGLAARRFAHQAGEVEGYDVTPAMIEVARREALAAGLENVRFAVGDATELPVAADRLDGAVTRFSIHHIPLPERMLRGARARRQAGRADRGRRSGGRRRPGRRRLVTGARTAARPNPLVLAQPAADARDRRARRADRRGRDGDPAQARLEDWLARGEAAASDEALVAHAAGHQPPHLVAFVVAKQGGRRVLRLQMWLARLKA